MSVLQSIILGIIQGLTEFFPVSSSGHLVIVPFFLDWDYVSLFYIILVHFSTLLALVTIFYKEIYMIIKSLVLAIFIKSRRLDENFKLGIFIIVASIPAALSGLFLEKYIRNIFEWPILVAICLIVTAAFLITGEIGGKKAEKRIGGLDKVKFNFLIAAVVGTGQALAIFPGISRSGATISFARFFGIKREESVRFSFLLSIPVIFGSFIYELYQSYNVIISNNNLNLRILIPGFLFSYLSGIFAIKFLMKFTRKKNLNVFAIYCIFLSMVIFVFYFLRFF